MASPHIGMPASSVSAGRKPQVTIYTLLLIVSLVALLVGCLFLYLEIKRFGGFGGVQGRVAALAAPSEPMQVARSAPPAAACRAVVEPAIQRC